MDGVDDVIVSRLRDVGFSLYEARLYLALLRGGAQNGNEAARSADVPATKVYSALDKLAAEGIVRPSSRGGSTRYTAIEPGELLARVRTRHEAPLDFLDDELPKLAGVDAALPLLAVSGERALLEAGRSIVGAARREVQVSCWEEDLRELLAPLVGAHERGVLVNGILSGDAELPPGSWLRHRCEDVAGETVDGRLLALMADDSEALIARVPRRGPASAVRSRHPGLTMIVGELMQEKRRGARAER
jgi:sugar-specific transcriptional regulator TrmB